MSKTILILGAGKRVGASLTTAFASEGYNVVVGRRNHPSTDSSHPSVTNLKLDLSSTESIQASFAHVRSNIGIPNVIVYNGYSFTKSGTVEDPFSVAPELIAEDQKANIFGVYTAIQEAVKGWRDLPADVPKVFIVTGNILPWISIVQMTSLGVGKAGAAYLVRNAAETQTYQDAGYRFYFASQVTADDGPVYVGLSGEAHARRFLELAKSKEQLPWEDRFKE